MFGTLETYEQTCIIMGKLKQWSDHAVNASKEAFNALLWRACNLTSFTPCLTGPVGYQITSRHEGPGFQPPGGYLSETGILLLVLSRYIDDPDVIRWLAFIALQWVLH